MLPSTWSQSRTQLSDGTATEYQQRKRRVIYGAEIHISTELVMLSNHLILWHPLLLLPSIFLSIRFFPRELALRIRWPKYWSFSIGISLSNEYSGLISYRIDWFDLLAVQGTLKRLPEHYNLKASILRHSAFSMVQLSRPYMTTGKTTALTRWSVSGEGDMWPFTFRQ